MNRYELWFRELKDALHPQGLFGRIDAERCLAAAERIEAELPDVIRQAERIVAEKEKIIASARAQAEKMLAHADAQANRRVADSVVMKQAEQDAARLREETRRASDKLLSEREKLAAETLDSLREYLEMLTRRTQDYAKRIKQ